MSKGLFAGMTEYDHQSFSDIMHDLEQDQIRAEAYKKTIQSHISKLGQNQYWETEVPLDFKIIISHALHLYETVVSELHDIRSDMSLEVKENHIKRLDKIATVAQEINIDIGKNWHSEYRNKDYGNSNFRIVERIYADTRDMAVGLLDLSNIAERLNDFIGKQTQPSSVKKKRMKLELSHKIAICSLIVALLVFLFGNNMLGNFSCTHTNSKADNILPKANVISTVAIDSLKLPYLKPLPILDKGLFVYYYFNSFILGGVNIDSISINGRAITGESLKFGIKNNTVEMDINDEPYIEFKYKEVYYSAEIKGRHYDFIMILSNISTPTLTLMPYKNL